MSDRRTNRERRTASHSTACRLFRAHKSCASDRWLLHQLAQLVVRGQSVASPPSHCASTNVIRHGKAQCRQLVLFCCCQSAARSRATWSTPPWKELQRSFSGSQLQASQRAQKRQLVAAVIRQYLPTCNTQQRRWRPRRRWRCRALQVHCYHQHPKALWKAWHHLGSPARTVHHPRSG